MNPTNVWGWGPRCIRIHFAESPSLPSRWLSSVRPFNRQGSQVELLILKPRKVRLRIGSPLFKLGNMLQI